MSTKNPNNNPPRSTQTKEKIINVYLDLIPTKKWDKITVKEICSCADITRGTFYQYYSDIYDLMEQIETPLLEDITRRYHKISERKNPAYSIKMFESKFDYAPPQILKVWFKFCKKYKKEISVLLDPKNGDTYFVKKLKVILVQYINQMMNDDGIPQDALRSHFTRLFTEMHLLAARSWLESDPDNFLSTTDIINLLNTMRVGANYLHYRQATTPDFDNKMYIPEDTD